MTDVERKPYVDGDSRQAFGEFYMVLVGKDESVLQTGLKDNPDFSAANVYTDPLVAQADGHQLPEGTTFKVVQFTNRKSMYEALKPAIEQKQVTHIRIDGADAFDPVEQVFRVQIRAEAKRIEREAKREAKAKKQGRGRRRSGREIAAMEKERRRFAEMLAKGEDGVTVTGRPFSTYGKALGDEMMLCVDTVDDHGEALTFVIPTDFARKKLKGVQGAFGALISMAHDIRRGAARCTDGDHYKDGPVEEPVATWWRVDAFDFVDEGAALETYPNSAPEEWRVGVDTEKGVVNPYHTLCPSCLVQSIAAVCPQPDCQLEHVTEEGERISEVEEV